MLILLVFVIKVILSRFLIIRYVGHVMLLVLTVFLQEIQILVHLVMIWIIVRIWLLLQEEPVLVKRVIITLGQKLANNVITLAKNAQE